MVKKIFFIFITSIKLFQPLRTTAMKRPQYENAYHLPITSPIGNDSVVFEQIDKLFKQISQETETYLKRIECRVTTGSSTADYRSANKFPRWSVWQSNKSERSFNCWQEDTSDFLLFQTLNRILTKLKCNYDSAVKEMFRVCRIQYKNNETEVTKIDAFAKTYKDSNPIQLYTLDSFLFRLVGRAFRSEDFEFIFKFHPFIFDLHKKLDDLHNEQQILSKLLPLYRGKKICPTAVQQLKDNIGGYITMNGFLSTTRSREIALEVFADVQQNRPLSDHESALFELNIEETTINEKYADISKDSQFPEEQEVLFSVGSVWKIISVDNIDKSYWEVKLSACKDAGQDLIQCYRDLSDDSILLMFGEILQALGEDLKAERFYEKMTKEQNLEDEMRLVFYYKIAMINMKQMKEPSALAYLLKAEELISSTMINKQISASQSLYVSTEVPSESLILNNLGCLYEKTGKLAEAYEYLTNAVNVEGCDRIDKARACDNLGLLYYKDGDYENAVKYIKEAVELAQDNALLPQFKHNFDAVSRHYKVKNDSQKHNPDDSV